MTFRPVFLSQAKQQWGSARETSDEIVAAIFELARQDEEAADRIWDDPSDEETKIVMEQAWRLADPEESRLHWGITRMYRDGHPDPQPN